MRLALAGMEEGTPHRHRHSGPESVRRRNHPTGRGAGFAKGVIDLRDAEVVALVELQLNASGRLRAHSLAMKAGGGWGRQGGSKDRGVYREGVLYPYPE